MKILPNWPLSQYGKYPIKKYKFKKDKLHMWRME